MQQDEGLLQVDRTLNTGRKPALLPLPIRVLVSADFFAFFVCFSFCFLFSFLFFSIRSRVDKTIEIRKSPSVIYVRQDYFVPALCTLGHNRGQLPFQNLVPILV